MQPLKLETFRRSITVPGILVERPGRTLAEVSTPMAGVITHVHAVQGEAVERYFPDVPSGQVGFTDSAVPFDLLILDPRDVPLLPDGVADDARSQARAAGLAPHQIGRLEVWYAEPPP